MGSDSELSNTSLLDVELSFVDLLVWGSWDPFWPRTLTLTSTIN